MQVVFPVPLVLDKDTLFWSLPPGRKGLRNRMKVRSSVKAQALTFTAAILALAATFTAGTVTPASAATIPYRSSTHDRYNCAGIKFHPYGDWFEIWENMPGSHVVYFYWAYYPSGQWHWGGWNNYASYARRHPHNFAEHHQIKFYVWNTDCPHSAVSPTVRYSTT